MSYRTRLRPHSNENVDWLKYKQWLLLRYSKHYVDCLFCYSRKYYDCFYDVAKIAFIADSNRNNVIKALIVLSKFTGQHQQFKEGLKNCDIKTHQQDALQSFLRLFGSNSKNTLTWLESEALPHLRENECIFAKFLKLSGLRVSEGIASFNLIIKLYKEGRLNEYYDANMALLQHFKYKIFLRGKKNAFISFIQPQLLEQICNSQPTTYTTIRKRLEKYHIKMRFSELRQLYGTNLVSNGITQTEQDLVCGRISNSVFVKFYWSPALKQLGDRIFKALETMDVQTQQPMEMIQ